MQNNLPPIFIINLDYATDRRAYMQEQTKQLLSKVEFVDAVKGKNLGKTEKKLYSEFKAYKTIGRPLHENEIGCYLSHVSIWKKMVDENINEAIIMEDDITISSDFKRILSQRNSWLNSDCDILNIGWDTHENYDFEDITFINPKEDYKVFKFKQHVDRACCYMLTRKAAKALLNKAFPIIMPLDSLTGNSNILKLSIYGVMPRLATWSTRFETTIITDSEDYFNYAAKKNKNFKGIIYRIIAKFIS